MQEEFVIYTDGGSRGNPGPSAAAYVVLADAKIIAKGAKYLGVGTNNQAEYNGVLLAYEWLIKNVKSPNVKKINFFLDSELVVRQLNGIYKIKDANLKLLAGKIMRLHQQLGSEVSYQSVLREKNKLADSLVNESLDAR